MSLSSEERLKEKLVLLITKKITKTWNESRDCAADDVVGNNSV